MSQKRLSNIELLRIISILLIISMHAIGCAFHTNNILNKELLLGINTIGNTGVTLFILISGYFGIHFKTEKLFKLLLVIWFYSITSYIVELTLCDVPLSLAGMTKALVPVLCKKYWFITCYIILYCFSPYINRIITSVSRRDYEKLILIWALFFVIAPTVFFFEIENDGGKGIVNMVLAYLIGQYLRTYGFNNIIKRRSTNLLICLLAIIFISNSLLSYLGGNIILRFARDNNLFIILTSIVIFYKFINSPFFSQPINYLAQFVFPLYLVQALITRLCLPWISSYTNSNMLIVYVLVEIAGITALTFIVESIRRMLLGEADARIARKLCVFIDKYNR